MAVEEAFARGLHSALQAAEGLRGEVGRHPSRFTSIQSGTTVYVLHTNGVALHYDYFVGEWSWFTNHEALDAVVAGDQYYFLRADSGGRVAR